MDELNVAVEKLTASRGRQKHQLSTLKKELKMTETDADENACRIRTQMEAVTNDLKSTKSLLDETTRREKQVICCLNMRALFSCFCLWLSFTSIN